MIAIAYLISIPALYFQYVLQALGNFKYHLITRIFFNTIMVMTFFVMNIIDHNILNIAYSIMIAGILTLGLTLLIFKYQNGKFEFDVKVLINSPIKNFKRSFKTSITIIFQSNIWDVCNLLKTVILIKISIDLFNATSYINNSFFFMEGVFFAIIAVINIEISKYLGHNKKEEAYEYAKKSFASVIITQFILTLEWIIYFSNKETL
jgi:Na+-driven multidrug efflux pump